MKEPLSSLPFGPRRSRRSNTARSCSSSGSAAFAEGIRYLSPGQWSYAVKRLSVYRLPDGGGIINLFETSSRSPLLFDFSNPTVLQNEINLRRQALSRGIYRFAEMEVLWFASTISLAGPSEASERKTAEIPLKIFVADIPELDVQRGDIQIRLGGQDYWIAPDWRTLFPNRPETPLSAIMLPENQPSSRREKTERPVQYLPGERFQIRLALPYPIVVGRRRPQKKHPPRDSYLKLCQPKPVSILS